MRHGYKGRRLNRTSEHRKALLKNLARAIIEQEQIKTTLPKAKELRPFVEKLVTLGKKGDLNARRALIAVLGCTELSEKVIAVLAKRYATRQGGYTRIMKYGFRFGDNAPMAIIEFVDRDPKAKGSNIKEEVVQEAEAA